MLLICPIQVLNELDPNVRRMAKIASFARRWSQVVKRGKMTREADLLLTGQEQLPPSLAAKHVPMHLGSINMTHAVLSSLRMLVFTDWWSVSPGAWWPCYLQTT